MRIHLGESYDPTKVRLFFEDESRFGLHTVERRRITSKGVKPKTIHQMVFEYYYLFGVIEPATGEDFLLELPTLNAQTFQVFIDAFIQQYDDTTNVMIMDRGTFHMAKKLIIPSNMIFIFLPPYSPELNPIERYWKHYKDQIAWRLFDDLQQLKDHVATLICKNTKQQIQSLSQFPFFRDLINV